MNLRRTKVMLAVFLAAAAWLCFPLSTLAATSNPSPVNASDFIKGLNLVGDLQLRYEYIDLDARGDETDNRMRVRFRLGMNWDNPDENWKIAAGFTTGGSDANSVHSTYSNEKVFETGDIRLDYAYAEHQINNFRFLAGQQKNPYVTSWALWDSDVRPAGLTAVMDMKPFFLTAGVYQARYVDKDIAFMEAVQAGVENDMLTAALGFYNYNRLDKYVVTDAMDDDYAYQILDLYVAGNIDAGTVGLTPYVQAFYNFGAEGEEGQSIAGSDLDPEDENAGYVIGVDAKIDRFKMGAAWAQIGADSVMRELKDSSFGNGLGSTDTEGFKLNLGYALTRHFSVTCTAYLYEAKERDLDQDAQLYQLDLDYKF